MRDKEAFFTYSQASSFGGTLEGSRCKRFSGGGELHKCLDMKNTRVGGGRGVGMFTQIIYDL